jgi:hypothetical protein
LNHLGLTGSYDHVRITAALWGRLDTTALTEDEDTVWLDAITEKMARASKDEAAFHSKHRTLGSGVVTRCG